MSAGTTRRLSGCHRPGLTSAGNDCEGVAHGVRNVPESDLPPVTDWVHDWDWLDPQWGANAIDIWNGVREVCPVATTERYGRAFMPVTYDAVAKVAQDTEHFSSIWVSVARPDFAPPAGAADHVRSARPPRPSAPAAAVVQPEGRSRRWSSDMREFCRGLIAAIGDRDAVDASEAYAQHIPVHGICGLLGVPESDADMFRDWIFRNFQLSPRDNDVRVQVGLEMDAYLADADGPQRVEDPADDLLTLVSTAEIDGEPIPVELQLGYAKLMIFAGIDTTWSAIGSGIWHLAQHADERARLVAVADDDMLWNTAIEEMLRFYAPVTMGRKVVADTEVAGCPVRAGEQVLAHVSGGQPRSRPVRATPDEFQLDRAHNRHIAFGLGIHRCIGSNLARLEMTVGSAGMAAGVSRLRARSRPRHRRGRTVRSAAPACLPVLLRRIDLVNTAHVGAQKFTRTAAQTESRREPRRCGRLRSAPSGASQADRSTTGRTSGVSLQLDQYIARLALRRGGRCRFSGPVPVSRSRPRCHRFTLTRLPVPSVLVPIGTVLTEASWGGPRSVGSVPLLRCPAVDLRLPVDPVASPTRPVRPRRSRPDTPQQVSVSDGYPSARSDPTPSQLPAPDADSPLPPETCVSREPGLRWPVNLSCSDPAVRRERCGLDARPKSKPPPHRPGAHALFGTMLSKYVTKPQVKRYFPNHRVIPETFPLPPGFVPSST